MKRLLIALLALVFMTGLGAVDSKVPVAAAPDTVEAPAEHLPAYDVCAINLPHPGSDWVDQAYWTDDGPSGGAYRCIGRHSGAIHYYIVCHDLWYWWWVPGLSAWVNLDCTP